MVLAFCYAFSTVGACVVGRTVANALFLARLGYDWLPLMYLIAASFIGLLAIIFLHFAGGRPLRQVVLLTLLLLSSSSIVLCQLVQRFDHAMVLLFGIYLLAEIRGCLNTIQYGILVNELFARSPSHSYVTGLLSAAATLAGIVFGTMVAFEVHQLGTVQLLYVVAGLEILAMIPIALLSRSATAKSDNDVLDSDTDLSTMPFDDYLANKMSGGMLAAVRSPYACGVALLVAITVIVGTLIEFQWKSSVGISFATNEDEMTSFFGIFQAVVNLATGLIQVLLTGRLLHRFGTRVALLVFPATLLASTLGVLVASVDRVILSAITLAKGCDVVKRGINDPAILLLYAPLSSGPRRQAITFVSGIVKPSAEAVAALLIISFAHVFSTRAISYVVLALLCLWLIVAYRRRRPNSC